MNQALVAHFLKKLLSEGLGFDLTDPNLSETPQRIAKMYCKEWFKGVNSDFKDYKHFLPFTGYAWVLYIPNELLVGASKPSRLVSHYASRPQLQENLTHQVLNRFAKNIKPKGAMVVMRALHECMMCRGAMQTNGAGMITDALFGCFFEPDVKAEGLELIKISLLM